MKSLFWKENPPKYKIFSCPLKGFYDFAINQFYSKRFRPLNFHGGKELQQRCYRKTKLAKLIYSKTWANVWTRIVFTFLVFFAIQAPRIIFCKFSILRLNELNQSDLSLSEVWRFSLHKRYPRKLLEENKDKFSSNRDRVQM